MIVELTPGSPDAERVAGRLHGPDPQHASRTSTSTSSSAIFDRDTRDYLKLLLSGGGKGSEGAGPRPVGRSAPLRARPTATFAWSRPRSESAARTWPASSTLPGAGHRARQARQGARRVGRLLERRLPVVCQPGARTCARREAAARCARLDEQGAGERRQGRQRPRPGDARPLARARRRLQPARATRRSSSATSIDRSAKIRSARSLATCSRRSRRCGPANRDLAAVTPDLRKTFKVLNTFLNAWAYNPPGDAEGFLFYTLWGAHIGASVYRQPGRARADPARPDPHHVPEPWSPAGGNQRWTPSSDDHRADQPPDPC